MHRLPSWLLLQAALSWLNGSSSPHTHTFMILTYPFSDAALAAWWDGHEDPPPSGQASHLQKVWDAPRIRASQPEPLESSTNPCTQVCLLVVASKESVHGSVLCLGPQWAFIWRKMTSRLRSGYALEFHYVLPISVTTAERWCINSTYGLHCPFSSGHHSRPASLNDIIKSGS